MIRRRPTAIYAVIDCADYIGRDNSAAAERFMDAVEHSLDDIHAFPGSGRRYESAHVKLADVRVWPVRGFRKYLIFYRAEAGDIEFIHLLHGARDIDSAIIADLGLEVP